MAILIVEGRKVKGEGLSASGRRPATSHHTPKTQSGQAPTRNSACSPNSRIVAEQRNHRSSVSAPFAITGKLFAHVMLDSEDVSERCGEPPLGQLGRETETVRRVGERDIVGERCELFD